MGQEKQLTSRWLEYESRHELPEDELAMLTRAEELLPNSYSPYSGFQVASVINCEGKFFDGVNVENAAYGPTNCAERTALFAAAAKGFRNKVDKIAVLGRPRDVEIARGCSHNVVTPCGPCRQVIKEFEVLRDKHLIIICASMEGPVYRFEGIDNLLPLGFGPDSFMTQEQLSTLRA